MQGWGVTVLPVTRLPKEITPVWGLPMSMQLDLSTLHDTMNCCQQKLKKTFSSVFTVFIFCPHFSSPVSLILVEMQCMYWFDNVLDGWTMFPTKQTKIQFLALMWSEKNQPQVQTLCQTVNELVLSDTPISCILLKSWTSEHKKQELSTYYYYCSRRIT